MHTITMHIDFFCTDCVFIKYAYNNSAYRFFIQKSSIKDIYHNFIMELRNVTFFEDVFLWKEAREIVHLREQLRITYVIIINKKTIKLSLEGLKGKKMTKIFGLDFLTYLLENEP